MIINVNRTINYVLKPPQLASPIFQIIIFIYIWILITISQKINGFIHTINRLTIRKEQLHPVDLSECTTTNFGNSDCQNFGNSGGF